MWLNIRDTFRDKMAEFVDEIAIQFRESYSKEKLVVFAVVGIIAIGAMMSESSSSQPKTSPPDSPPKTSVPDQSTPPVPAEQNNSLYTGTKSFTLEDKEKAREVARTFIPLYSTYEPGEKIAEKIKPYVTTDFYLDQQYSDQHSRPTFEVYKSKVLSVDKGFIEPIDFNLYWTGFVEVETTNAGGEKRKEKMEYAIMLVQEDGGWKVSEVTVLDPAGNAGP